MDHLKSMMEENFDWSLDPRMLREIYKRTNFDSIFAKLIAKDVIRILSPQLNDEPHNLVYDEELVYEVLISPLEKFICEIDTNASKDDVKKALEQIKSLNQPSKICGRILKSGDVTFSCNDCGLDNTCVVCIDCFHKSAHKDHNYRMSFSEGGGCCDCGDIEAWKQNYACTDHMASNGTDLGSGDFEDEHIRTKQLSEDKKRILESIVRIPKSVASKYFLTCQASLHYARMMLAWDNYNSLPQLLEVDESNNDQSINQLLSKSSSAKNYFTVLFNDEVHTYDHVINTLVKIVKCTKMTASITASTISREGRSFVVNDNHKVCTQYKEMIANVRDAGQGPLKVEVVHGSVLAHQAFALKLIEWIRKMSTISDAFRILTAFTLFSNFDPIPEQEERVDDMSLLEKIMLSNTTYWKIARVEWNGLLITTLLNEYSMKDKFARLLTRIYPELVQDYVQDDHDHSVSILTMTTQLYTVPSLACMLMEEENALSIIAKTLSHSCMPNRREHGSKRGFITIYDLSYLISVKPSSWTERLRNNVIEAVKIFLDLLSLMQGMDSVRRQQGQHLEYEPEWESGMNLQSRLITLIGRLVTYCSYDDKVLIEILKETESRLLKNGSFKMVMKELFCYQVSCIQYDVSTSSVSIHLPLTRFAAALILELMQRRPCNEIPYNESLVILNEPEDDRPRYSMIHIMEPALRNEVMIAQFRSGMWRRNGYSLVNQILYFHSPHMRREMFDRDILLLQECAAMCDANEFMIHLLNKFQLFFWASTDTREPPAPKTMSYYNNEELMTQTMSLGEEFLQLLLIIIGERYRVGVGCIKEEDIIKNEIIQTLCIDPFTRSDLSQKLIISESELDCIKTVADLKRSSESSTGKYELKKEYYNRFNPFFYHYSRRNQSNALDVQLKRKKNLKEPLICCPPPKPVELTRQFSNINQLLKCDIMLLLIQRILKRSLKDPTNGKSSKAKLEFVTSDLQLDQCLHLIGLGLYEQERNPLTFRFLQEASRKDLFGLLRECYEQGKRSRDLIYWLMSKTNELVRTLIDLKENGGMAFDEETSEAIKSINDSLGSILSKNDSRKQDNKKRNSELAAQLQQRIMAMMKASQDKFLSNPITKQLVAETQRTDHSVAVVSQPDAASTSNTPTSPSSSSSNQQTTSTNSQPAVYTTRSGRKSKPPKSITDNLDKIETRDVSSSSSTTREARKTITATTETGMDCEEQEEESDDESEINKKAYCESVEMLEEADDPVEGEPPLCILCRDYQKVGFEKPTMVLLAYIQRSAVLSKNRSGRRIPNYALTPSNQLKYQRLLKAHMKLGGNSPEIYSFNSDNSCSFDATFMPADLFFGPHVSTCGHVMHYDCWTGFFDAIMKREASRPSRNARHVSFELEKHEILCPLCECISNATIPLLPNYTNFVKTYKSLSEKERVFDVSREAMDKSPDTLSACLLALRNTVDVLKHLRHIKDLSATNVSINEDKYIRLLQPKGLNEVLEELEESEALGLRDFINSVRMDKITSRDCTNSLLNSLSTFAERVYTVGLDLDKNSAPDSIDHSRIFMMTTWSLSYTIQVSEQIARFKGKPILEELESSKNLGFRSLIKFACSSVMIHQSDMLQSLLVKKLRYLLINDEYLSSSPCCLDVDAFEMFVSLMILFQKLYTHFNDESNQSTTSSKTSCSRMEDILSSSFNSTSSSSSKNSETSQNYAWATRAFDHEYFRNLLHLMLILNSLQVIISMQNERMETSREDREDEEDVEMRRELTKEEKILASFYQEIILASGHPIDRIPVVDEHLVVELKNRLLPFLRSCSILFFHLTQVKPPEVLRTRSAFCDSKLASQQQQQQDSSEKDRQTVEEFEGVCHYLALPSSFGILFSSQEARQLARVWLRHSRVLLLIRSAMEERKIRAEVSLPGGAVTRSGSSSGSRQATDALAGLVVARSDLSKTTNARASSLNETGNNLHQQYSDLMPVKFIHQPHRVNRLVELPYDYSELVDRVSEFTCPSVKNEDSKTPTMCLVCGVMLCSQSYCCQRDLNDLASNYQLLMRRNRSSTNFSTDSTSTEASGGGEQSTSVHYLGGVGSMPANAVAAITAAAALLVSTSSSPPSSRSTTTTTQTGQARQSGSSSSSSTSTSSSSNSVIHQQLVGSCTYHAHECSGGVGLFLRVRSCQILLLSGISKGCYMPAPYIDDHGETDFGLMRGNPMHLNRSHYERLEQMWLAHAIPEQISRTLEYSPYASSINWHLH